MFNVSIRRFRISYRDENLREATNQFPKYALMSEYGITLFSPGTAHEGDDERFSEGGNNGVRYQLIPFVGHEDRSVYLEIRYDLLAAPTVIPDSEEHEMLRRDVGDCMGLNSPPLMAANRSSIISCIDFRVIFVTGSKLRCSRHGSLTWEVRVPLVG